MKSFLQKYKFIAILFANLLFCSLGFTDSKPVAFRNGWNTAEIKGIRADLSSEELDISSIYGDKIIVEIATRNPQKIPTVALKEGILTVTSQKKQNFLLGQEPEVKIFIPHDFTLEECSIKSASGDVDIENFSSKKLFVSVASSSLDIENATIAEDFCAKSASGKIDVEKIKSPQIKINSASGELSAEEILADTFDISTTSGKISVFLLKEPKNASKISSLSGQIELEVPYATAFSADINTKSGYFSDKINRNSFSPKGKTTVDFNGGGQKIELSSVSGKISVEYEEM